MLAVSIAVGKPFMGINLHDLKNLSVITSIVVNPLELGRSVMVYKQVGPCSLGNVQWLQQAGWLLLGGLGLCTHLT